MHDISSMPNDAVILFAMTGNGQNASTNSAHPISVWYNILAFLSCFLHTCFADILFERL